MSLTASSYLVRSGRLLGLSKLPKLGQPGSAVSGSLYAINALPSPWPSDIFCMHTPGEAPFTYGPLQLEPAAHLACLDGVVLDLTRTEFDLLCLMAHNPRRAFSRAYLLETIWGGDYISGDRSVDNAILRLRKKLGPFGYAIETIWGVGYRLSLPLK